MVKSLQEFLYSHIPLTKDMGLELVSFNENTLTAKAPLLPNINDKASAFGGSSSALMIISAWSLIKLCCDAHQINADIVIHENHTQWQKPLYDDLFLEANFTEKYNFKAVKHRIEKNKHFRVQCEIKLVDVDANIYSTMTAKYVIIPKKEESL